MSKVWVEQHEAETDHDLARGSWRATDLQEKERRRRQGLLPDFKTLNLGRAGNQDQRWDDTDDTIIGQESARCLTQS